MILNKKELIHIAKFDLNGLVADKLVKFCWSMIFGVFCRPPLKFVQMDMHEL